MIILDLVDLIAISLSLASTVIAGFSIYKSTVMHKQDLTHQNYEDVKNWYEKTLHVMKSLYVEHAENYSTSNKEDLYKDIVTLSQLIDSGRLYFPNIKSAENRNKPEAFRGKRPLIIDLLILYYDIFTHNKQKENGNTEILRSIQRAFSSEIITYLKQNKSTKKAYQYTKYDKNGIINISNLDCQTFRNVLNKEDIVTEIITKTNAKDLSKQIMAEKAQQKKENEKITNLEKKGKDKTNKIKDFFWRRKKDKDSKKSKGREKEIER